MEVTVVGVELNGTYATCARGIKVIPDVKFEETTFKAVRENIFGLTSSLLINIV